MRRFLGVLLALVLVGSLVRAQDFTFPMQAKGILRVPPGTSVELVAPDSARYVFVNHGETLVILRNTARLAVIEQFVDSLMPPDAPPVFVRGPLRVVFVARELTPRGWFYFVGILYAMPRPAFPRS